MTSRFGVRFAERTSGTGTQPPAFNQAASGGFAEAAPCLKLLAPSRASQGISFISNELSETAAVGSSAMLNLQGALSVSLLWATDGITIGFISCQLPKGDQGCEVSLGFWCAVKKKKIIISKGHQIYFL